MGEKKMGHTEMIAEKKPNRARYILNLIHLILI